MKKYIYVLFLVFLTVSTIGFTEEEKSNSPEVNAYSIFDDKMLLDGYEEKYKNFSKEILLEMIKDDNLNAYKTAAAVHVFNNRFHSELVSREKKMAEKILLKRLNRTESPFVQVETMYALCKMDRYRYFKSMVKALIQKLDHYNETVNTLAFEYLSDLVENNNARAREARRVFQTLRKTLFLSRRRLAKIETPDKKLSQKLKLLRWSIKILGTQEIKKLPKEVLNLL